ncbi:MAG: aspartate aminotransferase family protein [Proteobacteria bacterium]|jgi:aromatic-L-amino-acid/L-tryptophan decarboxylase|nr:aspartate aminotransferase family protein [Pseudomonadota bacterium]
MAKQKQNNESTPLRAKDEGSLTPEPAECGRLSEGLQALASQLEQYLTFEQQDALANRSEWQKALQSSVPAQGIGFDKVIDELAKYVIPNGSQIPNPGFTSFITTGASTMGTLTSLACSVASPQRVGLTAFTFLEELSLQWLASMFELPAQMRGVYSSGGSVANLVSLGVARQSTFEALGIDPAEEGFTQRCRIYASDSSHRSIHRAAAILGMGRNSVVSIRTDSMGRMSPDALRKQLTLDSIPDSKQDLAQVAIIANAGSTSTGVIDPLLEIGEIAREFGIWFHVDGAYGLPGILDPRVKPLYRGLELADSVIVDPHKWLGAPVGIGATFVRDRELMSRAFAQGASDYFEGSFINDQFSETAQTSMDSLGVPYSDFSVELSAPARGAVVWALLREIGTEGMVERVCRHNSMARRIAELAKAHPNLELVQEPTLSICCFRYVGAEGSKGAKGIKASDLNELNQRIHRRLIKNGRNMPSTAQIGEVLAIRPCFVGARTTWQHAEDLVEEVIELGAQLSAPQ